ncbi:MAG: hypothetical protein FWG97_01430 [Deltaproteobacteria bacterium]|nr:hypothetical protein [Deltaproteobacteria bacterium]
MSLKDAEGLLSLATDLAGRAGSSVSNYILKANLDQKICSLMDSEAVQTLLKDGETLKNNISEAGGARALAGDLWKLLFTFGYSQRAWIHEFLLLAVKYTKPEIDHQKEGPQNLDPPGQY